MNCPIRNSECEKLKYHKDELYCSALNLFIIDIHHNSCPGFDNFSNFIYCPLCNRKLRVETNICQNCGYDLRDWK